MSCGEPESQHAASRQMEAAAARKERDRLYVKDAAIIRKNVVEVLRQLDFYERFDRDGFPP